MIDPVLLGGVALILAALYVGFKLLAPGLRQSAESSQSAQGFNDAKARMVDSTTQLIEKRSGNSLQVKLEKSGSQLRSGEWLLGVVASSLVLGSLGLIRGGLPVTMLMCIFVPVIAWFLLNRKIQKNALLL